MIFAYQRLHTAAFTAVGNIRMFSKYRSFGIASPLGIAVILFLYILRDYMGISIIIYIYISFIIHIHFIHIISVIYL